jgi:hypothetical protein
VGNADLGITSPSAIETADRACKGKLFSREEIPDAVELCAELRGHSNAVELVRFSLDGGRLYSASKDETIPNPCLALTWLGVAYLVSPNDKLLHRLRMIGARQPGHQVGVIDLAVVPEEEIAGVATGGRQQGVERLPL